MKTLDLDKPFKPGIDFWVVCAILAVPVLWFAKPWTGDLPVYSKIASIISLPFAATVVSYCPFLFAVAVIRGDSTQKKIFRAFAAAIGGVTLWLGIKWYVYDFGNLPDYCAVGAVLIANSIFFRLHPKEPIQRATDNDGAAPRRV
jgi:hypothetical protein